MSKVHIETHSLACVRYLRHNPNPVGLPKDTSCRSHQGEGDHHFSNITAPSAEGQSVDLGAEASGCMWTFKIDARSAVGCIVAQQRGFTAAASRHALKIPLTRLPFPPCSHLLFVFFDIVFPLYCLPLWTNSIPFTQALSLPNRTFTQSDPSMTFLAHLQGEKECSSFTVTL